MKQGCSERHYLNYYGLGGGGGLSLLVCWLQAVQARPFRRDYARGKTKGNGRLRYEAGGRRLASGLGFVIGGLKYARTFVTLKALLRSDIFKFVFVLDSCLKCSVEFECELSICSGTEKNYEKP